MIGLYIEERNNLLLKYLYNSAYLYPHCPLQSFLVTLSKFVELWCYVCYNFCYPLGLIH